MSHDAFDERRIALEEEFFAKQSDELLQKLKDQQARASSKEELRRLTGINHEQVLDALAALKIGGAATLVMSVLPMIEVAWADGKVDATERQVVLEQASVVGVKAGSEPARFLESFLNEKPALSWNKLWAEYVRALVARMKPEEKELLKHEVLGRARLVAEASGGVVGTGWAVSRAERAKLDELALAFA
jgi:tellurite resistance protein